MSGHQCAKIDNSLQKEPTHDKRPYDKASKEFVARNNKDKALEHV